MSAALVLILFSAQLAETSTAATSTLTEAAQEKKVKVAEREERRKDLPLAVDWVGDGVLIGVSAVFGYTLGAIVSTGELTPQQPVDANLLIGIDRPWALSDEPESSASLLSDLGVGLTFGYALFDIVRAGVGEGGENAATYAFLYAEALAMNYAIGNLVKIAVRRPRPTAYSEQRMKGPEEPLSETNLALSFYSMHTALAASAAGTAAYLAFYRDASILERVAIIAGGLIATSIVGIQRVRAHSHFPTDVICGGIAGAAVGVLVPHLHRVLSPSMPDVAIQASVAEGGEGGTIGIGGKF